MDARPLVGQPCRMGGHTRAVGTQPGLGPVPAERLLPSDGVVPKPWRGAPQAALQEPRGQALRAALAEEPQAWGR